MSCLRSFAVLALDGREKLQILPVHVFGDSNLKAGMEAEAAVPAEARMTPKEKGQAKGRTRRGNMPMGGPMPPATNEREWASLRPRPGRWQSPNRARASALQQLESQPLSIARD